MPPNQSRLRDILFFLLVLFYEFNRIVIHVLIIGIYIYLFINSIFSSKISLVSGVPVPIAANPIEITELQKSSLKHTHPPLTDHRLAMCPIIIKRMAHLPPFQHFLFTVQPAPIRKGTYRCSASLLGYRKASVKHIH